MELIKNRMEAEIDEIPFGEELVSDGMDGGVVMVILLNDNETTMGYVVHILSSVFELDTNTSTEIMSTAHNTGSALIGHYSEKRALQLLRQLDEKNKASGNRLRCLIMDVCGD